jgi:hypothetical protein
MYSLIRILAAIVLASPVILIPVFRHTFQNRRAFFIVSALAAALVLGVFLYQWPAENQFGGFTTAEQAITYQYGKSDWLYTVEEDTTALVLSDKTSEVLQKEQGRFYLISPMYLTRRNAFSDLASVIIRGDQRTQERFVQVTMLETDRAPETIMDNKGTTFEKAFTYNGLTYYAGSFLDDGLSYTLYIDGVDAGLMKIR